jgi:pyruvate,water dikinase
MRAREELRHEAMAAMDRIRGSLLSLAANAARAGQLPRVDDVFALDVEEVCALDTGWVADPGLLVRRREERERLLRLHVPDTFPRSHDFHRARREEGSGVRTLAGLPLVDGDVDGRAWVLEEPASELPAGFAAASTILVARAVDAGWIATFGLVAGVVVETGGDLSHGSIVLRESSVPSVTNVASATARIATGSALRLRGGAGVVELREEGDREVG